MYMYIYIYVYICIYIYDVIPDTMRPCTADLCAFRGRITTMSFGFF